MDLSLDIKKYTYMPFYWSHSLIVFDYNINGHKFVKVENTVKDLGLAFDTKLTFFLI